MANYHLSVKNISRNGSYSAAGYSAYVSRDKVKDEEINKIFDFTNKKDNVYKEIIAPEQTANNLRDRESLWNEVQRVEKNKNARLAKEIEVSLPRELDKEEHIKLIKEYVNNNFTKKNIICDVNIHYTPNNPHSHILFTTRAIDESGNLAKSKSKKMYCLNNHGEKIKLKNGNYKTYKVDLIDLNSKEILVEWRKNWADTVNKYLEKNLIEDRIDHRSYEEQNIKKIPQIHLGRSAHHMEQRGIKTDRGNINREIDSKNKEIKFLLDKQEDITKELYKIKLELNNQSVKEQQGGKLKELENLYNLAKQRTLEKKSERYKIYHNKLDLQKYLDSLHEIQKDILNQKDNIDRLKNKLDKTPFYKFKDKKYQQEDIKMFEENILRYKKRLKEDFKIEYKDINMQLINIKEKINKVQLQEDKLNKEVKKLDKQEKVLEFEYKKELLKEFLRNEKNLNNKTYLKMFSKKELETIEKYLEKDLKQKFKEFKELKIHELEKDRLLSFERF